MTDMPVGTIYPCKSCGAWVDVSLRLQEFQPMVRLLAQQAYDSFGALCNACYDAYEEARSHV